MSLKKNIIANYASQIYCTLVSMVMVPVYVRYMGMEAYGLIGFFTMLQIWFQLLDVGLTPTMAREAARFRGGAVDALSLRRLLRALEGIFVGIALLGATLLVLLSGPIASGWLKAKELPLSDVKLSVILIALIIALRWICGLYRGAVMGFEHMVWLSGFNVLVATARFVFVIPFFIYFGAGPTNFFTFQLVIALIETGMLVAQTYRLLPRLESGRRVRWQWHPLKGVLKFSLGIAFTNSVWILITQTDKLVLSAILPLSDYAYFTLAVLVASSVTVISTPISMALQPRLTRLSAQENQLELIALYRNGTQLVGIIAVPAAIVLAFFSEQVLWAWTGDATLAAKAAPVLTLYALGNGIGALGAFPYYLQFAKGDLRMHIMGNAIFASLLIPSLIWATWQFGMIGAGYVWLLSNLAYFVLWIPRVHGRFVKGLHSQWLVRDIAGITLFTLAAGLVAHSLIEWSQQRILVAIEIALLAVVSLAIAAAASSWVRETLGGKLAARVV